MDRFTKTDNVLLFVPNIIGYIRVVLLLLSLLFLNVYPPWPTVFMYGISGLLDALDGHAARMFNQGTLTETSNQICATACLMLYLTLLYPHFAFVFQVLIALDFSSHYMQMVSTLSTGLQSHKSMRTDTNWLLQLYYTNRLVLFSVCLGNELFFVFLYVLYYAPSTLIYLGFALSVPVFVFKQVCNVIQLTDASMVLVSVDTKERSQKRVN
ncbi:hypothetical protein EDD86DRAFT_231908 [Gorgonomyces haynaldii]|nr:hypothetical protein EDD86DRAFT_231908 [Gorgonomyces haynaldii]